MLKKLRSRQMIYILAAASVGIGAFAAAAAPASAHEISPPRFTVTNEVSDQPGVAPITDPDLVNAWGLAASPTSPLWVANNGSNTATLYSGANGTNPIAKLGKIVTIPGGAPTGQVFNGTGQFVVTNPATGKGGSAPFIFDSEGGDITAWNNTADPTNAFVVNHVDGAVFKGLALWQTPLGNFLVATDFATGAVDVFDSSFKLLTLDSNRFFHDPFLPSDYHPFGVLAVGETVYVSYAKTQPGSTDEAHGPGTGFVDAYTDFGQHVRRIASHGSLNAPWGMAIAPASFGRFAGDLLVGNFGDGHISAFHGDDFDGLLRGTDNKPVFIEGLWGLLPGTANTGGVANLWFSAGPNDENDGLVGLIGPAAS
jgi:uncharacterized protein (TIGR03118 family)